MLDVADARREAEEFIGQLTIVYPNAAVLRTALRGIAAHGLSWFDAQIWAYAEVYGISSAVAASGR